jgi:hypothetical protein
VLRPQAFLQEVGEGASGRALVADRVAGEGHDPDERGRCQANSEESGPRQLHRDPRQDRHPEARGDQGPDGAEVRGGDRALQSNAGLPGGPPRELPDRRAGAEGDEFLLRDVLPADFAAVELLIRGGAGVVFAQPAFTGRADRQFDTHQDDSGVETRAVMAPITPVLSTFLDRTLALPGRNVVTLLVGEFSRTIPKSDHEPGGTATVIGKHVRTGTTGPQHPDGAPPENAPPPEALWAYVASALRLPSQPFGPNPAPRLIL